MANTFFISISVDEAANIAYDSVINGSMSGELIDSYEMSSPNGGGKAIVNVYEKHYYRAGNRLTLTVIIDNFNGFTRVHTVAGGGGEGFFRFDWGAAESFETVVVKSLQKYVTN